MKKLLQRLLAPVAAFLTLGSGASAAQADVHVAKPALWSISDADTTVYLFGTIHLLPDNYQWRTPKIEQAVGGSQQLVIETIVDEKDPMKLFGILMRIGMSPGLPPLVNRVPAAKRAALLDAVKKSGFPPKTLDNMETWAAAFILLGNQFKDLGLKNDQGVEMTLRSAFAGQGKPVGELESNLEQLGFFDRLPEKAQRELLEGAIEQASNVRSDFNEMLTSWVRGDVRGIARSFNRDLAASPELAQALIKQRNANWSKWIEQRMAQPGAVMVAVGAGHLAGRDSVIDLLKRDGYRVRRLQ
ncbi:MAG TPA: TraB/GumN family protein [Sphingomicrobium sp.]|jgi:uncharacterized protein YbaP (TraB family)|nr:TraB/GumN family protein [Sphingomicrobium sp.]